MKRIITALVAMAALVAAVAAATGTATAATATVTPAASFTVVPSTISPVPSTSSAPYVPWYPFSCATGTLGALTVVGGHPAVSASVTPCAPTAAKHSFGIVGFRADWPSALAEPGNLQPYASSGATDLTVLLDYAAPVTVPAFGVCLMLNQDTRLACVRVDLSVTGVTAVTPIGVDDPLVDRPVIYNGYVFWAGTDPACGNCVSFPF
jgi:hypothetical protein